MGNTPSYPNYNSTPSFMGSTTSFNPSIGPKYPFGINTNPSGIQTTPVYDRPVSIDVAYNDAVNNEHKMFQLMNEGKATMGDYMEACRYRNAMNDRYYGRA